MIHSISIIALAALFSLLSGCGCSREKKSVDGMKERMQDAAYTNMLVQTRKAQVQVASQMAEINAAIERLGKDAVNSPEYTDLTNRLAQCRKDAEMLSNTARTAIRDRIMKDSKAKGNLKK